MNNISISKVITNNMTLSTFSVPSEQSYTQSTNVHGETEFTLHTGNINDMIVHIRNMFPNMIVHIRNMFPNMIGYNTYTNNGETTIIVFVDI